MIPSHKRAGEPEGAEASAMAGPRIYGPEPMEAGWSVLIDRPGVREETKSPPGRARGLALAVLFALPALALLFAGSVRRGPAEPAPVDHEFGRTAQEGRALVDAVKRTVAGYFGAASVEEKLAFVCEPERVRGMMDDHHALRPMVPRTVVRVEVHATMTRFSTRHPYLFASVVDARNEVSVAVLRQESEGVKIDWEAQEAYNPLDLTNAVRLRPSGAITLRVMARPSDYYNFEFVDANVWQAFVLWNPNDPEAVLHGYCRRGSGVGEALLDLTAGGHAVAARVVVAFSPEMNGSDTVEIREIAAPHWFGGDA